jgi:uncharacterized CHY-type Zn-finger protein
MASLVSDFIITPVLRQARRFSEISRSTLAEEHDKPSDGIPEEAVESYTEQMDGPGDGDAGPSRPLSSSTLGTQSTSVEVPHTPITLENDVAEEEGERVFRPLRGSPLPEDDGMHVLRKRLLAIQSRDIAAEEKARLMHEALMEGYRRSRASSRAKAKSSPSAPTTLPLPAGQTWEQTISLGPLEALKFWQNPFGDSPTAERFVLTAEDVKPTYAPQKRPRPSNPDEEAEPELPPPVLGCQHYQRNVKLQCSTCQKWYTCRFCHDAAEDHTLIRKETKNMLCMLCACPQKASDVCRNCGVTTASYYCNICKLWDDHPEKSIYHCDECGICRRGKGLGKDFFHCKVRTPPPLYLE